MAVNIPIWDGNPGAVSGSTPFGFYDSDSQFQADAPKFAHFAARRLGYPVVDVELQSGSFYACFEEAITEYGHQVNQFQIRENLLILQGSPTSSVMNNVPIKPNLGRLISLADQYGAEAGVGGDISWKTGSIEITSSVQRYDLNKLFRDINEPGENIEIKRVHHYATPAVTKFFDPFAGTAAQGMLDTFSWGGYSPGINYTLMPAYAYQDALRLQSIEINQKMRKSNYSFELINNELRLFPKPTTAFTLWFDYIVESERSFPTGSNAVGQVSDYTNVPYQNVTYRYVNSVGRQWIYQYGLALVMETLGWVRTKYSSIPIPNSEVQLNGDTLISQAETEKQQLIEELRETLEELGRGRQSEKQKDEAEYMQEQLNKVPLKIYIG